MFVVLSVLTIGYVVCVVLSMPSHVYDMQDSAEHASYLSLGEVKFGSCFNYDSSCSMYPSTSLKNFY